MMHGKLYMHENFFSGRSFYKFFPCNVQNVNAAKIFQALQDFPCAFPKLTLTENFVIVIIYSFHRFSLVPPERFHMQQCFSLGIFRTFEDL